MLPLTDPAQVEEIARTNTPGADEHLAGIDKADPRRAVLMSRDGGSWRLMQDFCGGTPVQRRAWCRRVIRLLKVGGR